MSQKPSSGSFAEAPDKTKPVAVRTRYSLLDLQARYEKNDKKPLTDLMRAWKGIKELGPDKANSFYNLAGFHGEPFSGAGYGDGSYWGGYCNHGNILFPTWHRMYCLRVEEALRSIKGCEDVTLPYWDETDDEAIKSGLVIPWALTNETFELDGVQIPNPLRSFKLPARLTDSVSADDSLYTKPAGYETVRYPLSGLVGTPEAKAQTDAHNKNFPDYKTNVQILNVNVLNWLVDPVIYIPGDGVLKPQLVPAGVASKFKHCLDAPNYTVFSNTTSAGKWNDTHDGDPTVVPLESPHNSIHLSVGGFDVPAQKYDRSPIPGANGDMGENNTASFDPIFFFHHCNIDRVFWLWQKKHEFTDKLEIMDKYPGTNSSDSQGATPGTPPNSWLTLDSPLDPYKVMDNGKQRAATSKDVINIEKQLGYTYGPGSLDGKPKTSSLARKQSTNVKKLRVSGINRGPIRGSFVISAFVTIGDKKYHIGSEAILSRWNVTGCANCQTHLDVRTHFDLDSIPEKLQSSANFDVEIVTRDTNTNKTLLAEYTAAKIKPFQLDIR